MACLQRGSLLGQGHAHACRSQLGSEPPCLTPHADPRACSYCWCRCCHAVAPLALSAQPATQRLHTAPSTPLQGALACLCCRGLCSVQRACGQLDTWLACSAALCSVKGMRSIWGKGVMMRVVRACGLVPLMASTSPSPVTEARMPAARPATCAAMPLTPPPARAPCCAGLGGCRRQHCQRASCHCRHCLAR